MTDAPIERTPAEQNELAIALRTLTEDVYAVNRANGWFEKDRTVGEDIALLHSEASEALEAYREHGLDDITADPVFAGNGDVVAVPKPEGFGSECADILIRLVDTCKRRGIDLAFETERKLAFNVTRGIRHGNKNL